ncbi:TPA: class I SAM-dependent methyltransferase [Legionella bozemanae]
MGKWSAYFLAHLDSKHHPLVEKACAKFSDENDAQQITNQSLKALDLGCGTGRDTVFLVDKGFNVTALDAEREAIEITRERTRHKANQITFIESQLEKMQLPEQYHLISSNLTLSFVLSKYFHGTWSEIVQHITFDGRFSGQFFGDQHEWANPVQSYFSYSQMLDLFRLMFEIEFLEVSLSQEETTTDGTRLWHQYDIIACKKAISPEKTLAINSFFYHDGRSKRTNHDKLLENRPMVLSN